MKWENTARSYTTDMVVDLFSLAFKKAKTAKSDNTYTDEFNAAFDKWCETLDYDYQASENKERFAKDKADYIHQHLDRDRWSHRLDEELFEQFLAFYDKNVR